MDNDEIYDRASLGSTLSVNKIIHPDVQLNIPDAIYRRRQYSQDIDSVTMLFYTSAQINGINPLQMTITGVRSAIEEVTEDSAAVAAIRPVNMLSLPGWHTRIGTTICPSTACQGTLQLASLSLVLSGRSMRRCTFDPVVLGSNSLGRPPASIKLPLVLPRHQGGRRRVVPSSRSPSLLGAPQDRHNRDTAEMDEDVMLLLLVVYASAWLAVVMHIFVGNAI